MVIVINTTYTKFTVLSNKHGKREKTVLSTLLFCNRMASLEQVTEMQLNVIEPVD